MPNEAVSTIYRNCHLISGGESFGVQDGRITSAEGHFDRQVDLQGLTVLPAFADGHSHPLFAGRELLGPQTTGLPSIRQIADAVRDFAIANPAAEWIDGGTYDPALSPDGIFDAQWLDEAVPDRPVVLHATDHHTIWVNSEAMRRAGINRNTPDRPTGVIERFPDGEPRGTFREWDAISLILRQVPKRTIAEEVDSLAAASRRMAAAGVTWWQDAWIDPGMAEIYLATSKAGRLAQDVDLAFRADPHSWRQDFGYFSQMRDQISSTGLPTQMTSRTVKFFADGVIECGTAELLEPYTDDPGYHGMPVWDRDELTEAALCADMNGFQLHIHAIGDGGVRLALDVIEMVIAQNPPRPRRPVIAHLQLVDAADLVRFSQLGVIANFTPSWTCLDRVQEVLSTPRIGKARADRQYQIRTLLNSGATVSFGSDWPVSSEVPLAGLPTAVHRQSMNGHPPGGWLMHEALTIDEALAAYTSGVAYQAFAENEWGVLARGRQANFVLLASDPRKLPIHEVAQQKVIATYLRGEPIFDCR